MIQILHKGFKLGIEGTWFKRDNLIIHEEENIHEIPSGTAASLSIIFHLTCKPCTIQSMTLWLQLFNSVIYHRLVLGDTATLYY